MRHFQTLLLVLFGVGCTAESGRTGRTGPTACTGDRVLIDSGDVEAFLAERCASLAGGLQVFSPGTLRLQELEQVDMLIINASSEAMHIDAPALGEVSGHFGAAGQALTLSLPALTTVDTVQLDLPELELPLLASITEVQATGQRFVFPLVEEAQTVEIESSSVDISGLRAVDGLILELHELPDLNGLEEALLLELSLPSTDLFALPSLIGSDEISANRPLHLPLVIELGSLSAPSADAPGLVHATHLTLTQVGSATHISALSSVGSLQLTFAGGLTGTFTLPLVTAGRIEVAGGAVVFSAPELVSGSIEARGLEGLLLPQLATTGTLYVDQGGSVSLPVLATADSVDIPSGGSISLPLLVRVQDFVQLDAGAEVELSRLAEAGMVNLFTTCDISLPALAQATEVFWHLPDDASVSAPLLASEVHLSVNGASAVDIGAGAAITRATLVGGSYTTVHLPWAPHLDELELSSTALTSVDLGGIERVETLILASEPLISVTAPDLTSLGDLGVETAGVSAFSAPDLTRIEGILHVATDSQLPGCTVAALVAAAEAGGAEIGALPAYTCD